MGTYSHSQLNRYLLNKNSKVKSALEKISKNGQRIIFVVDDDNNLIGSVSDGDIRKKLLDLLICSRASDSNKNLAKKTKRLLDKFYNDEFFSKICQNKFLNK